MPEEAKKELLSANKASSSLPKIIKTGYNALDLIYFFTSGEDEVKCWTIRVRSYITACYWVPILISFPLFTVARHKSPTGCWFVLSLLLFVTYSPHKNVGTIHTDFYHGFVCAEGTLPPLNSIHVSQTANRATATVMKYVDFKELGSDSAVKAAGKYTQQGKNYTVEDGDIIFFRVNAGAGLNKK